MDDGLDLDDRITVDPKRQATYLCPQCGKPGVVDPGFTLIDPRYAIGKCSGDHVGKQYLIRDGVNHTPKKRRKRAKEK
jgi:hypothetical protein